ncbi:MAG: DUF4105 domain-containing protein [Methylomonas sp.]|jgi:hypothetical protein|uniref:Lnb N-terminal periplasmic domain-containing protein n=1 Tax=Methylomonas sp. TaxID=418 RepID=UPI0025F6AEAC|nr:DUF4105 domain-containing protein [Methylomonas sp.]MCK9604984.1 DUF4105 domain-containing protein [Methylomonas sp.]
MHFIKACVIVTALLLTSLWGVCVLYFGDSASGWTQRLSAVLFGLLGLSALIGNWFPRWRRQLLIVYWLVFVSVLIYWLNISPSNQRQWQADAAKVAYATFAGDRVTVHNIRNFDYRSEFDYQSAYYTKTFDLNKLQGIDLFSVYWMGPAIAHIILSFDFGANDHLAVSIEARKEQGEGYSTIKGFFRQYEQIYFVADERDVIRLRTNYRHDPPEQVYLYRLQGSIENGKRLFLEYMHKINALHQNPAFYNTLFDNCSTAIWLLAQVNEEHPPFSWKILLSGYLPEYLYESQWLDTRVPFIQLQQQAHINSLGQAADQAADFSARIRLNNNTLASPVN